MRDEDIRWTEPHAFHFGYGKGNVAYCYCGLPKDNPLHTDNQFDLEWQKEREKADIEWLEKAEKVMPEVVKKLVADMKAKEIIEALRPEWEEWHEVHGSGNYFEGDYHPDFWEWLMEKHD